MNYWYVIGFVCYCVSKTPLKKFKFFLFFSLLQINIFLVFSNYFDVLMWKIIFKKILFWCIFKWNIITIIFSNMLNTGSRNASLTCLWFLKHLRPCQTFLSWKIPSSIILTKWSWHAWIPADRLKCPQ